jgi:hypothetical protein
MGLNLNFSESDFHALADVPKSCNRLLCRGWQDVPLYHMPGQKRAVHPIQWKSCAARRSPLHSELVGLRS